MGISRIRRQLALCHGFHAAEIGRSAECRLKRQQAVVAKRIARLEGEIRAQHALVDGTRVERHRTEAVARTGVELQLDVGQILHTIDPYHAHRKAGVEVTAVRGGGREGGLAAFVQSLVEHVVLAQREIAGQFGKRRLGSSLAGDRHADQVDAHRRAKIHAITRDEVVAVTKHGAVDARVVVAERLYRAADFHDGAVVQLGDARRIQIVAVVLARDGERGLDVFQYFFVIDALDVTFDAGGTRARNGEDHGPKDREDECAPNAKWLGHRLEPSSLTDPATQCPRGANAR